MKTKKWRDVKNALVMVVVMAAMMSTATYAWFTLTSDATVTGMQMTAGGSSGLQVSLDKTNWADSVDLTANLAEGEDPNKTIHQVTVKDADTTIKFYKPTYAESQVTGVTEIATGEVPTYVAKYDYYIRAVDENATVNVGIKTATGTKGTDGSYIRATDANDANSAAAAVRVGIVVDDGDDMIIFEPNSDTVNTGEAATSTYEGAPTSDVAATAAGVIGTGKGTAGDYTSEDLFIAASGEGTKITMYVWLEGTDADCRNSVQADALAGQMTFTIVE